MAERPSHRERFCPPTDSLRDSGCGAGLFLPKPRGLGRRMQKPALNPPGACAASRRHAPSRGGGCPVPQEAGAGVRLGVGPFRRALTQKNPSCNALNNQLIAAWLLRVLARGMIAVILAMMIPGACAELPDAARIGALAPIYGDGSGHGEDFGVTVELAEASFNGYLEEGG